jgi:hypothetical protein
LSAAAGHTAPGGRGPSVGFPPKWSFVGDPATGWDRPFSDVQRSIGKWLPVEWPSRSCARLAARVVTPGRRCAIVLVVSATGIGLDLTGKAAGRRKLIAVAYADMVNYSRLTGLDDVGTLRRLRALRRR